MSTVTSKDGTAIGFDQRGAGSPLILIDGALCDRSTGPNGSLAEALEQNFNVFRYDRRGRGESGNNLPVSVEREVDDIAAVMEAAGGSADLYGISSGGALALEAAKRVASVRKVAVYEIPFVVDDSRTPLPNDFAAHMNELVEAERRGDAVTYFMKEAVQLPGILVALMRFFPGWSKTKAIAPTLPYDIAALGDTGSGKPLPAERWASVTMPTLVMAGGKSPAWLRNAMDALADVLPNAQHRTLEGQTHQVKAKTLAPVLTEFFHA
jgi:pimeloyl-ACP methyl ester carboxylesterase